MDPDFMETVLGVVIVLVTLYCLVRVVMAYAFPKDTK